MASCGFVPRPVFPFILISTLKSRRLSGNVSPMICASHQAPSLARDNVLGITLLPHLTERQMVVLRAIYTNVLAQKNYPTQREIADQLGCSQPAALGHINALVKKGYLTKNIGEHGRNMRLTVLAMEKLRGEFHFDLI